jgi:sodium/potassium-transporting ATPase subunit alpha
LSIAAKRMAAQNVLVKDLQGVETLGSLTLLATDKTGTLTRNQMTVTNLWSAGRMYHASSSNTSQVQDSATSSDEENEKDANANANAEVSAGEVDIPVHSYTPTAPGISSLVDIATLNSKIKFDKMDVPFGQREILGDATETGLARWAGRALDDDNNSYDGHVKGHKKVFEVPFNSTNKWALVIVSGFYYHRSLVIG